jgi:hypothetical protein
MPSVTRDEVAERARLVRVRAYQVELNGTAASTAPVRAFPEGLLAEPDLSPNHGGALVTRRPNQPVPDASES